MFVPRKGRILTHIAIGANEKNASFVYPWLRAHATFDATCFPAFAGPPQASVDRLIMSYANCFQKT